MSKHKGESSLRFLLFRPARPAEAIDATAALQPSGRIELGVDAPFQSCLSALKRGRRTKSPDVVISIHEFTRCSSRGAASASGGARRHCWRTDPEPRHGSRRRRRGSVVRRNSSPARPGRCRPRADRRLVGSASSDPRGRGTWRSRLSISNQLSSKPKLLLAGTPSAAHRRRSRSADEMVQSVRLSVWCDRKSARSTGMRAVISSTILLTPPRFGSTCRILQSVRRYRDRCRLRPTFLRQRSARRRA